MRREEERIGEERRGGEGGEKKGGEWRESGGVKRRRGRE